MLTNPLFFNPQEENIHTYLSFIKEYLNPDEIAKLCFSSKDCIIFFTDRRIVLIPSYNTYQPRKFEFSTIFYRHICQQTVSSSNTINTLTLHQINGNDLIFTFNNASSIKSILNIMH